MVDRKFFEEIGLLDEGMEVYGGENVELSIRVSVPHISPLPTLSPIPNLAPFSCLLSIVYSHSSHVEGLGWVGFGLGGELSIDGKHKIQKGAAGQRFHTQAVRCKCNKRPEEVER